MGKYIKIFTDALDMMVALDDAECGRLFRAMLIYRRDGTAPELPGAERILFPVFKEQLDVQMRNYEATVIKNKKNGEKNMKNFCSVEEAQTDPVDKNGIQTYPVGIKNKELRTKNNKNILSSSDDVSQIIDYLNARTGKAYRDSTKATQRLIDARIREGFTVDDFKAVIGNRAEAWKGDKQMAQYLRPATLFGTKFESYLQAVPTQRSPDPRRVFQQTGVDGDGTPIGYYTEAQK